MPSSEPQNVEENAPNSFTRQAKRVRNLFSIPKPVKQLFDLVPVITYPPNELPQRGPTPTKLPSLYVFSTEKDAAAGKPSFNPSCLRWQAFLKISGIQHQLISSNNHASPTGVLPFLLPAIHGPQATQPSPLPIASNKFVKYALENGSKMTEPSSTKYAAYQSLIDNRIRSAWLYTLYLDGRNFNAVAKRLYVSPTSTNILVQATISHQLCAAAEAELLKTSIKIDVDDLYSEAYKAFEALSILLGEDEWFFGSATATLFDATVFAYTHLLLDENMGWKEKKLVRAVSARENLMHHRERILVRYFNQV